MTEKLKNRKSVVFCSRYRGQAVYYTRKYFVDITDGADFITVFIHLNFRLEMRECVNRIELM